MLTNSPKHEVSAGKALSHPDLAELLNYAKSYIKSLDQNHKTARGNTFSGNRVLLTWEQPSLKKWASVESMCSQHVAHHYYSIFVDKRDSSKPESTKQKGDLLFPYTYATRARYWDGGWGYVVQVLDYLDTYMGAVIPTGSISEFRDYVETACEQCHLQTLLAVLTWLGSTFFLKKKEQHNIAQILLSASRVDQLERVIAEIAHDSSSRRAVTGSFVYPSIDYQLTPIMGIPPYQSYQLLPSSSEAEPLCSLHYHRSLDLVDGILLDFYHDLQWLLYATSRVDRPIGDISILAGNLHVYHSMDDATEQRNGVTAMVQWLKRVTDAYESSEGIGARLLTDAKYEANLYRIYDELRRQE